MTAVLTTDQDVVQLGRTLVAADLFDRLVGRIVTDHAEIEPDLAVRIMDQALVFLLACATSTKRLAPSEEVDLGWHTFILYTKAYAKFCDKVAGRFIHHDPDDDGETSPEEVAASYDRTLTALASTGYYVDLELWPALPGRCGETGCGSGRPPCQGGD